MSHASVSIASVPATSSWWWRARAEAGVARTSPGRLSRFHEPTSAHGGGFSASAPCDHRSHDEGRMTTAFDIAADLDTPVSAYLKLRAFRPCFLLESVEGGERLGRYSFIGFGDAYTVRLEGDDLHVNGARRAAPGSAADLLDALRGALRGAPQLEPVLPSAPFAGGLVGWTGYALARRLEGPDSPRSDPRVHDAAYVAPS